MRGRRVAPAMAAQARPLHGVRVLEFAQLFPAPYTGLLLAELGAEVIKVESPAGDPTRRVPPFVEGSGGGAGAVFCGLNRGKKSVVLDLKTERDAARYRGLAATCRIVLDGFRPGVADRLGVGFEALAAGREDLLYLTLSGFGPEGPLAGEPGHDVTYQAWMGALSPARPTLPNLPTADATGALWAAALVLAHLAQTGNHRLDASLAGALLAPLFLDDATTAGGGSVNPVREGLPGYNVYACGDGAHLAVGALEPHFWERLCRVLGDQDLYVDGHPAREPGQEVVARTQAHFLTAERSTWLARLEEAGVPAAPLSTPAERQARPVALSSWDPPGVQGVADFEGAPALGEHTDGVLGKL